MIGWRLVKQRHAATAFSGDGARDFGGRWNHAGTPVVYLSGTLALAALEQFVHLGRAHASLRFVAFRVEIPDVVTVESIDRDQLPAGWRDEPPPDATQDLGDAFVARGRAAILRVPSVLVPVETNYLLNPAHPDFTRLARAPAEPFGFDPRMWK